MMQQYLAAKAEHPEAILMFRMGDFFEMFFDDARLAAKELDLVLTSRDKDRGVRLCMVHSSGLLRGDLLRTGLLTIVPLVLAIYVGTRILHRIPREKLRLIVFVFLFVVGLKYMGLITVAAGLLRRLLN